ncbi:hypothetical protein A6A19_04305 [Actinobacillus delphinicola]|uniref:Cytochrome c class I n=1 Tax=Actinobacillus delphinicola TaxID=51161 RepID=A0A448TT08_9PAST|nr:c-type cytochrome [Actinobacillus delphinicola]MDG6897236.1 hypothetical protein [Actinobacillus delphinicola]VEJ09056.1 cytochrome c class I [Actinobacillus delphinicola]
MKRMILLAGAISAVAFAHADVTPTASTSTAASTTDAAMIAEGQQIFENNCATCHGRHADKKAFGRSAIINQLDQETIVKALQMRKAGLIQGPGNPAKSRLNDEQMQAVAAYIQTLKK